LIADIADYHQDFTLQHAGQPPPLRQHRAVAPNRLHASPFKHALSASAFMAF